MKTLEEVQKDALYKLQSSIAAWKKDPRGLDNYWVNFYLNQRQNQLEHLEELVKIQIAERAHFFVSLVATRRARCFNGSDVFMNTDPIDFSESDELVQRLLDNPYPEVKRNEFVQAVYEHYGFTDVLPTIEDLRGLEKKAQDSEISEEERKSAKQELLIAQRKLGIGNINGGLPEAFPSEVKKDTQSVEFKM